MDADTKQVAESVLVVREDKKVVSLQLDGRVLDSQNVEIARVDPARVRDLFAGSDRADVKLHYSVDAHGRAEVTPVEPPRAYVRPHRPARPHGTSSAPPPMLIGKVEISSAAKDRRRDHTEASIRKLRDRYAELDPVFDAKEMDKIRRRIERLALDL